MGSFPLTKSSYLILEAWNAAISSCGLQFFLRENTVFPLFLLGSTNSKTLFNWHGINVCPLSWSPQEEHQYLPWNFMFKQKISLMGEDCLEGLGMRSSFWDFSFVSHCVQSTHPSPWGGAACLTDFAQIILALWSKSLNKEVSFWLIKKLAWPLDCLFPSWSHGAVEPLKHGLKENLTTPAEWEHLYYYLDKSLLLPNSNSYISLFIDI